MNHESIKNYSPRRGSLPRMVLDFFCANPDEELTSADISRKFETIPSGKVAGKLQHITNIGLLSARREKYLNYAAGPMLPAWSGDYRPVVATETDPKKLKFSEITLRDYFAAKALTSVIANWESALKSDGEQLTLNDASKTRHCIAEDCFAMADAMLQARSA